LAIPQDFPGAERLRSSPGGLGALKVLWGGDYSSLGVRVKNGKPDDILQGVDDVPDPRRRI